MRKKSGTARLLASLADIKAHLRIEGDAEDALLNGLLMAASAAAANFCGTEFTAAPPEPVRLAILLHVGHFYAHRESGDSDAHDAMLKAYHALLWPYREPSGMF